MNGQQSINCDQVVFTSIRSPTGEGYRIVAATAGVRADEKTEITTRSPSHGGLCAETAEATGLLSYRLESGRRCVAYCCHAGQEHTGRGGYRVYTHVAVLDADTFAAIEADPIRLHAALGSHLAGQGPVLKPSPCLDQLTLQINPVTNSTPDRPQAQQEWIWALADMMLEDRQTILAGLCEPLAVLHWAILCIPAAERQRLALSANVKFSSRRGIGLVLIDGTDPQLMRTLAGHDEIHLIKTDAPAPTSRSYAPWLNLLQDWFSEGRSQHVIELTSRIAAKVGVTGLNRLSEICRRADEIDGQDADQVAAVKDQLAAAGACVDPLPSFLETAPTNVA